MCELTEVGCALVCARTPQPAVWPESRVLEPFPLVHTYGQSGFGLLIFTVKPYDIENVADIDRLESHTNARINLRSNRYQVVAAIYFGSHCD